jgi:hypothetical protein
MESMTMTQSPHSSQRSILLMVTEEDGDQQFYLKTEENFSWPGVSSGPTVAVGYDCGYNTAAAIATDWAPYIDAARVQTLQRAAGYTGSAARAWVAEHKHDITITWAEALAQFQGHELLKTEAIVDAHLPNTSLLSGDSYGAIVSLTYNRGPSFDMPGAHYVEMRAIKAHMIAKRFDLIPNEFLSMRRLWAKGGDLWNRRTHEALLFRDGLVTIPAPAAPIAQAAA